MTNLRTGSALSDSFNILYSIFTDQISDTSSADRAGSDFIFSAWPNKVPAGVTPGTGDYTGKTYVKYPIVVLTSEMDGSRNKTVSRKNKQLTFSAEVYNKSMAKADQMTNQITHVLDIVQEGLEGSGLAQYELLGMGTSDVVDQSGATVHRKTATWSYDYFG